MAEPVTDPTAEEVRYRVLVSRLSEREEVALAELYDSLCRRVYALAVRIVRQPSLAEEVVDDTFMQVWREADRFDATRGRVVTWILTICRSRALDALRRVDPAQLMAEPQTLLADAQSSFDNPESILDQFQRSSAVRRAIETLPPRERQVVALAFFRGMSHQEIADSWALPLGSVKTLMHRAFGRLREQLDLPPGELMEFHR